MDLAKIVDCWNCLASFPTDGHLARVACADEDPDSHATHHTPHATHVAICPHCYAPSILDIGLVHAPTCPEIVHALAADGWQPVRDLVTELRRAANRREYARLWEGGDA